MTDFDADWLRMREPFDLEARDRHLITRFAAATRRADNLPRRIVDLAAGSGAGFRALAPLIGGDQAWLLVDHDPALIAAQAAEMAHWSARNGWIYEDAGDGAVIRTASGDWRMRAGTLDLAQGVEELDLAACDGVTTSAFLDLVSSAWLERLCAVLVRHRLPLLAMLTVDGRREWQPALAADEPVGEAFTRHQSGDKGFGPALGARAADDLAHRLKAQGYEVATARSDWRIGAQHREFLLRMVEESARVANETEPHRSGLFDGWSAQRHAQIESGRLSLKVGHLDLLAIPP